MSQVHYEVYIRKTAPAPWALQLATEERSVAMQTAEDMLADGRAAAIRVTKETLDPETMEFRSLTVLTKGAPEVKKRQIVRDEAAQSSCTSVADLYGAQARETIGRALDDWLARNGVTAFELMHRADLVDKLEASGVEYQHALQKIAIPESQGGGQPVHEIIRVYQKLTGQAIERVIRADRRKLFPDLNRESLADAARRLANDPDRAFLIGGALCAMLKDVKGWRAKVDRLLDLAEQAPDEVQPRALCQVVIEQLLCEMLGSRAGLADLLGPDLDLGGALAALVRLAAPVEVEALVRMDATVAVMIPPLNGAAERLGRRMGAGEYKLLASALARRVLRELMGPRRLRPSDPAGEIAILRALAMGLTASAGRLLTLEEVQQAFVERSKTLVTADFVGNYLGKGKPALEEARALIHLCENVAGAANKRSAARWLSASVTALRFEKELRASSDSASSRLSALAVLQRAAAALGLPEKDEREIVGAIGVVGGHVEADARLTLQIARAPAPLPHRLGVLLKLAAGETAPLGPAADRAKAEAVRLFRSPDGRAAFTEKPEALVPLRGLMRATGLAA